jgi:hypothetical protein
MYHNKNTNVKQNPFPRANAKRSDRCFTKCKAKTTHQQSLLVLVQQATLSAARLGFWANKKENPFSQKKKYKLLDILARFRWKQGHIRCVSRVHSIIACARDKSKEKNGFCFASKLDHAQKNLARDPANGTVPCYVYIYYSTQCFSAISCTVISLKYHQKQRH